MAGEISNFIAVWTLAVASLCYCFAIGRITSKGAVRLLSLLPVIAFFFILPSNLYSVFLGVPTYFFLSWVATFKLLLFAFGNGPLSNHPPIGLSHFISVACFPVKTQERRSSAKSRNKENNTSPQISKKFLKSPLNYATKLMILATFAPVHEHKDQIHPKVLLVFYGVHMYLSLELLLAVVGAVTSSFNPGLEVEPQFDEPYLATSLQDFWGRRWNITASNVLRTTVHDPLMRIFSRWIGRMWAWSSATIATFLVSGIMHELVFYYIGREGPTWEMTWFFVINGFGMVIEVNGKNMLRGKLKIPQLLSWALFHLFFSATSVWLFLPSLVRCGVPTKARAELAAITEFVKEVFQGFNYTSFP